MKELILASASPRRADLLRQIELSFEILPSPTEELRPTGDAPEVFVVQSAQAKGESVWELVQQRGDTERVLAIGADTIVCLDGQILGKPVDEEDAKEHERRGYGLFSFFGGWDGCFQFIPETIRFLLTGYWKKGFSSA